MSYHYLLDLALILLSTKLLGIATGKFQMPRVVGALLAGLILGPAALNILSETAFLSQLSELGVIVILFTAGMGTDLRELRGAGKAGFLVALCGVLVPMLMGTGFGWLAGQAGWLPGNTFLENIFLGTVLTATSVSITVETLKELGHLDTRVGSTILAAALIDDVLGLVALTVVSSMAGGGGSLLLVLLKIVLFFAFAIAAACGGIWLFRQMIAHAHQKNLRRYPVFAFVLCLLLPVASPLIFSFFIGMAVKEAAINRYTELLEEGLSYFATFFLGVILGVLCEASTILNPTVLVILALAVSAIGGLLGGWLMYLVHRRRGEEFNPVTGIAGVSCVPSTAKLAQHAAMEENPFAMILPVAMGANISGVITSAVAAGIFVSTIHMIG